MKCFYSGRQCTFEIADPDMTIFAASVNVNSKSQVETNEGSGGSGSPSAAHCDADPARMIDKSTHPTLPHNKSITNTPTARYKYIGCDVQIQSSEAQIQESELG